MTSSSILVHTAERLCRGTSGNESGWRGLAVLYAAAVQQLSSPPARGQEDVLGPERFGKLAATEPTGPLSRQARETLHHLAARIVEVCSSNPSASRCSDVAAEVVEHLGPPLFRRLRHVLRSGPVGSPQHGRGGLFRVVLDYPEEARREFLLVLSFVDPQEVTGDLARGEGDELRPPQGGPSDGWEPTHQKVFPRFVRLAEVGAGIHAPAVHYLESVAPAANRRLAARPWEQSRGRYKDGGAVAGSGQPRVGPRGDPVRGSDGADMLRLAAIPLHRDLAFSLHDLGRTRDGKTRFRMVEPSNWPDGWEQELREAIRRCSTDEVGVATLPELSGSPKVVRLAQEALSACENGFPVLLGLGSWHVDREPAPEPHSDARGASTQRDSPFRNRLTVVTRGFGGLGVDVVLTHDKFQPYGEGDYVEGHEPGEGGLTFLVTSVGLWAVGICKDWYVLRDPAGAVAAQQLAALSPRVAICPMMTNSIQDLTNLVASRFKSTRTAFVAANACGTVRKYLRGGACCRGGSAEGRDRKMKDVRSFIAAPERWFGMTSSGPSAGVSFEEQGRVCVARASCACPLDHGERPGGPGREEHGVFVQVWQ